MSSFPPWPFSPGNHCSILYLCIFDLFWVVNYFMTKIYFPNTASLRKSSQSGHNIINLPFPAIFFICFAVIYWLGLVQLNLAVELLTLRYTPHCGVIISFLRMQLQSLAQKAEVVMWGTDRLWRWTRSLGSQELLKEGQHLPYFLFVSCSVTCPSS